MNENRLRVHFIGGPADGDVRVIDPCTTYRVAVLEHQPEVHAYNAKCRAAPSACCARGVEHRDLLHPPR